MLRLKQGWQFVCMGEREWLVLIEVARIVSTLLEGWLP
jgi:hypothetical protein